MSEELIFINENADKIDDIFFNNDWKIKEIYDRIYKVIINDKTDSKLLVKTYENKLYAFIESKNLEELKDVKGVPKLIGSGFNNKINYIILTESPGIDLFDYIEKYGLFSEEECIIFMKKFLTILKDVHENDIIHKDIKPENIIYDKKTGEINLIDFEGKFTTEYQSPEQVKNKKKITTKTDLWSTGMTCYFMLTGKTLFENEKQIRNKKIKFSKKLTYDCQDFLSCLIERNEKLRYDAEEALNHVWLNE